MSAATRVSATPRAKATSFAFGGLEVAPGERRTVDLPLGMLSDHTPVNMSVQVVHGRRPGPAVFVSAAIHGDEVIGVEIVRRLLTGIDAAKLRGTLLAVPIVNAFGFLNHSRYLPDRRDLNRSFPGNANGSLAARLAHLFMEEIVARCVLGVDLHSAAIHRTNLPQLRISPVHDETRRLAEAFGAPVILSSSLRDGSLRAAARDRGVDVLLYEAGEGLRFDETAVRAGTTGILRVLRALDMLPARGAGVPSRTGPPAVHALSSRWLRAPEAGLVRVYRDIGEIVAKGEVMGIVADPFGEREHEVRAENAGIVIGRVTMPVVNAGDALFHVARIEDRDAAVEAVEGMEERLDCRSVLGRGRDHLGGRNGFPGAPFTEPNPSRTW